MSEKRAAIGFRGMALAPVSTNTAAGYATGAGVSLPHAGGINRTVKETKQDLYYDDELYAQVRDIMGEDVEIRVAEVPLSRLGEMGLGTYDSTTETLEADFDVPGNEYAVRFVVDTVDHLPYYFNYRLFQLTGIRFDNFTTKKDNVTVCEVIITGVFKRPLYSSAAPWAVMQLKADKSNQSTCTAYLTAAETLPVPANND